MYYALNLLRLCRLDECIAVSTHYLTNCDGHAKAASLSSSQDQQQEANRMQEQMWFIQTKALVMQNWFDDLDADDDAVNETLLDGEQANKPNAHRTGTSLQRRQETGRPMSSRHGFARPGTRGNNNNNNSISCMRTPRPLTARLSRLGTALVQSVRSGTRIDALKSDLASCARGNQIMAKLLCNFLLYVEHRPVLVLELGTIALGQYPKDWWWMSRVGQAYYRLGLFREAEQQFKAALALQENVANALWLAKVFIKMNQPLTALEVLSNAAAKNMADHHLQLGMARIYEKLYDTERSCKIYLRVLQLESSNVEAIACLAAYTFYEKQQPEVASRLYRRLLQMGVQTTQLWNNLGLCCFYGSQYDIALSCLQRAIAMAGHDDILADVWYNIGHVGIRTGDLGLAHRAFKIALGANPHHSEALNNLAVLKIRMGQVEQAVNDLSMAVEMSPGQHESLYNLALLSFRAGNLEKTHMLLTQALDVCPDQPESVTLRATLQKSFAAI